ADEGGPASAARAVRAVLFDASSNRVAAHVLLSSSLSGRSVVNGGFVAGPERMAAPRAPSGARGVLGAVRLVAKRLRSAEEEARGPRIADRPAAGFIVQFEQRAALAARDARVGADSLDGGLGIDDPGRQASCPEPPGGALCVYGSLGGRRVGCVAPAGGAAIRRKRGNPEAMDLGDDGVAGDAVTQLRGDLAHAGASAPASPQQPDALRRPRRGAPLRRG